MRVRFTSEIASVNALARWKKSASAVTFATRALRRSDSRIAGLIQRQHELETGASGDAELAGHAAGVALLESRLAKMRLRTERMGDDGNCQFRALSHNLFGSQDHHAAVRERCVERISRRADEYSFLFESDAEFRPTCAICAETERGGTSSPSERAPMPSASAYTSSSPQRELELVYEPGEEADEDGGSKRLFLSYNARALQRHRPGGSAMTRTLQTRAETRGRGLGLGGGSEVGGADLRAREGRPLGARRARRGVGDRN